jgi:TnpA family transposase
VSDRAVTVDSDDEREIGACELESERQIVTIKDALRACMVITEYYDAHGADDNLDIKLYCIEKDLQRRLSNAKKQTNITDFFTLKQNNV